MGVKFQKLKLDVKTHVFLPKLCEDILRQKCKKIINKRLDYSSHVKKFRRDKSAHAFQSTNAIARQKPLHIKAATTRDHVVFLLSLA